MNKINQIGQKELVVNVNAFKVFLEEAANTMLLFVNGFGVSIKESGKLF